MFFFFLFLFFFFLFFFLCVFCSSNIANIISRKRPGSMGWLARVPHTPTSPLSFVVSIYRKLLNLLKCLALDNGLNGTVVLKTSTCYYTRMYTMMDALNKKKKKNRNNIYMCLFSCLNLFFFLYIYIFCCLDKRLC